MASRPEQEQTGRRSQRPTGRRSHPAPDPGLLPRVLLRGPRDLLPRDSEEYAASTVEELRFRWANVRDDERRFMAVLGEVLESRLYVRWPAAAPYGDINELCQAELGASLSEVRQTVATTAAERIRRAALATNGEVLHEGKPPTKLTDSVSLSRSERASRNGIGRDAQQQLDYLARHDAQLLKAVRDGSLSVDAAYRQAKGTPRRITMLADPAGAARVLRRHFSGERLHMLIALLREGG